MCLCYHGSTGRMAVTPYGWEGNRKPCVTDFSSLSTYRVGQKSDTSRTLHYIVREVSLFCPTLNGLEDVWKGDEHTFFGVWLTFTSTFLRCNCTTASRLFCRHQLKLWDAVAHYHAMVQPRPVEHQLHRIPKPRNKPLAPKRRIRRKFTLLTMVGIWKC